MDNNEKKTFDVAVRPEVARGCYSNLAAICHSRNEFVIDFATMLPAQPHPEVQSRIIMAPEHAKRLLAALSENIGRYEATFGHIGIEDARQAPKGTFNIEDFNPNGAKS